MATYKSLERIRELKKEIKELEHTLEIERQRRIEAEKFIAKFKDLFSELLQDTFEYYHHDDD